MTAADNGRQVVLDVRFSGETLRVKREELGLSFADMASFARCAETSYRRYEDGAEPRHLSTVKRIAHRLGLTVDDLYVPADESRSE